jgi:hypothetical protein
MIVSKQGDDNMATLVLFQQSLSLLFDRQIYMKHTRSLPSWFCTIHQDCDPMTTSQASQGQDRKSKNMRALPSGTIHTHHHMSINNLQSTAHSPHVHLNNHDSRREPLSTHHRHAKATYKSSTSITTFVYTSEARRPVISAQESRSAGTHRLRTLLLRPRRASPVVQARQPRDVAQGCSLQRPAVAVVPVKVLLYVPRGLSRGFRSGAVQTLCYEQILCYKHGLGVCPRFVQGCVSASVTRHGWMVSIPCVELWDGVETCVCARF